MIAMLLAIRVEVGNRFTVVLAGCFVAIRIQ
jgi:hypothetical protein